MSIDRQAEMGQRVSTLRTEALALLQEVSHLSATATGAHSSVIGRLQHVANDLGIVQSLVCPQPLAPPPVS